MNNLIGRKCKGFKFKEEEGFWYKMDEHIGEVGEITKIEDNMAKIQFESNWHMYPLGEIEKHLVPEETEIPELGDGILMEVSDDEDFKILVKENVLAKYKGLWISVDDELNIAEYKYARPIKQKTTLTYQEIADKFNIDINQLEIIKNKKK
jgi:hypothetical protein